MSKQYKTNKQGYLAYRRKNEILGDALTQVTAREFYNDVFPDEALERQGHPEDGRANMIIAYKSTMPNGTVRMLNHIVFSGKAGLDVAQGCEFAVCGMCTYAGRRRTAVNAYTCYGFAFDLDGVGEEECKTVLLAAEKKVIPAPQYIVNSGHGLHLYYLFQHPVPLYPAVRDRLQRLKTAMTRVIWTNETSYIKNRPDDDHRDYQGIYQNMRMVGSLTKLGRGKAKIKYPVTAYRYNTYTGARCTLTELNEYVDPPDRVPLDPDYSSWDYAMEHKSLAECQQEYPDWYRRRIIEQLPANQWTCKKALYTWWLSKIQQADGARDGTRYNCVAVLFIYAVKCAVPYDEVLADAMGLVDLLDARTVKPDNRFTEKDVLAAAAYYKASYARYSIKAIEQKTHIMLPRNKRNGRPQKVHMATMRAIQGVIDPAGSWRNKNGRPIGSGTKQQKVQAWRAAHPNGKKIECERDTGLSRHTVLKWWDAAAPTDCQ